MYSAVPKLRHIGNEDEQYPLLTRQISWLFVASNVFNSAWICTFVWGTNPAIWISTVFILGLEGCLIAIYLRADLWKARRESVLEFLAVDVAFSVYLGWSVRRPPVQLYSLYILPSNSFAQLNSTTCTPASSYGSD